MHVFSVNSLLTFYLAIIIFLFSIIGKKPKFHFCSYFLKLAINPPENFLPHAAFSIFMTGSPILTLAHNKKQLKRQQYQPSSWQIMSPCFSPVLSNDVYHIYLIGGIVVIANTAAPCPCQISNSIILQYNMMPFIEGWGNYF